MFFLEMLLPVHILFEESFNAHEVTIGGKDFPPGPVPKERKGCFMDKQTQQSYNRMYPRPQGRTALPPGTAAPNFKLRSTPDQFVQLSDLRGQPVVLAFYPADWSPVCGDQMTLYNEILPEFQNLGAGILGISVDGAWCHAAFARDRKLHFPLLADFEPKGEVAKNYGVYRQGEGVSERALFVIDAEGNIHWSYVSPIGVNPGAAGILSALEDLQNKKEEKMEEKKEEVAK